MRAALVGKRDPRVALDATGAESQKAESPPHGRGGAAASLFEWHGTQCGIEGLGLDGTLAVKRCELRCCVEALWFSGWRKPT